MDVKKICENCFKIIVFRINKIKPLKNNLNLQYKFEISFGDEGLILEDQKEIFSYDKIIYMHRLHCTFTCVHVFV